MPSVHSISINNFRGIEHLEQTFDENNLIVLIGRCDSGKSTVLKAISLALCPYWNPSISSADFHNEDITKPIEIIVTVEDVPEELLTEKKYGLYFRLLKDGQIVDDVGDGEPDSHVLTIKFVVDSNLEPKWYVTNGRNGIEDVEIKQSDRARFKAFYISDYIDSQFTLSKGSPLYSLLTKSLPEGISVGKKLLDVTRDANEKVAEKNNFAEFDQSLSGIKDTAASLGLDLGDLKALLELKENVYSQSSITLHEGDIPFHLRGKGAKRLLSIAIQLSLVEDGGIILIDEIEQGLEPDRVVNIVKLLKTSPKGQVFISTHSSESLCEVEYSNVYILQAGASQMGMCDKGMSSLLRTAPYTFFAKRIICCEGKTEYGIIRAFGEHIRQIYGRSLSSLGICPVNCCGGTNNLDWAPIFMSLGYDVSVFSDNDDLPQKYPERVSILENQNIPLFRWDEGCCTEQQIMKELPWEQIADLLYYLLDNNSGQQIRIKDIVLKDADDVDSIPETRRDEIRLGISQKSKENNKKGEKKYRWFKDIPGGEIIGIKWTESISELAQNSTLKSIYNDITSWILRDVKVD
jgi:AAA15 family ATPase/GTPase